MLQRAASNAYSWWYASHVRTKQSKWLEQSLQDMGDKVEAILKLISEDGDSFAKRAEMYYKGRPELINFVEESYKAYRSLAERYDHISKELQNANTTLAAAFPDQYQVPMDDDDDEDMSPRTRKRFNPRSLPNSNSNVPKAPPKFPSKNIKAIIALTSKANRAPPSRPAPRSHASRVPKSGLTMTEAINEIDKLQKQILTLQTEKEFAKSSYESGYAKYWDIDDQINGTQEKISKLQDEFEISQAIEDDDARTLMAEAALKSCNDTLTELQEKQEKAAQEAKTEHRKIKDVRKKLNSFKGEVLGNQTDATDNGDHSKDEELSSFKDEAQGASKESKDLEVLQDKLKEHFEVGDSTSLSVLEMAEKIDELVNKVINFESVMSSQTALIHTLRLETDELQSQIESLEHDKAKLISGKTALSDKLGEMENKLKSENDELLSQIKRLEDDKANLISRKSALSDKLGEMENKLKSENDELLSQIKSLEYDKANLISRKSALSDKLGEMESKLRSENDDLQSQIKSLEDDKANLISGKTALSDKLGEMENKLRELEDSIEAHPKEEVWQPQVSKFGNNPVNQPQAQQTPNKKEEDEFNPRATQPGDQPNNPLEVWPSELVSMPKDEAGTPLSVQPPGERRKEDDEPDWQHLFTNGLESKEQVLLAEYTTTLRNYKETKKKLCEVEMKNEENFLQVEKELKELKTSLSMKDEEIRSLRHKLSVLHKRLEEYQKEKEKLKPAEKIEEPSSPLEEDFDIKAMFPGGQQEISAVEQKLRADIDEILEENLDFWMRFSGSFGQVQKFQNEVEDLLEELVKIEKSHEKKGGSSQAGTRMNSSLKSDVRPIYKHLREKQTELTVWLEQSEKLKEELQRRFSQLCHIQDDIKHALSAGAEDDDMKFTSFQAAKFQGEVVNMQQENNKVGDELQAGMDYITNLQIEVERATTRLNEEMGVSSTQIPKENGNRPGNHNRVPLRSFIFGVKPQKKKQSIFSCVHPAMMNRRYNHLKGDKSP